MSEGRPKAMVVGGGGWLGGQLVRRLAAQGRSVIAVDVSVPDPLHALPGVEVIQADIRALDTYTPRLAECGAVFNCSGLLHPRKTSDLYALNRDAPVALYKACIRDQVGSFVHTSSINAQGSNESSISFSNETCPPHPTTHYGVSKLAGDRKLMQLAGEGRTRLIVLRPGVFYGEFPSKNLREFMEKLRTWTVPLFSSRGFLRTYVDVAKMAEALLLAEHNGRSGEVYLIGDVEPMCTLRFYQIIAEELGTKPRMVRMPAALAHLCESVAFLAGNANVHLRLPTIVGEFGRNTFCSVQKAQRELGFQPHTSSEEGLRRMVRSSIVKGNG